MNLLTRGMFVGAFSILGASFLAGCSSHEETTAYVPPAQVVVQPAPVVVAQPAPVIQPAPVVVTSPAPAVTEKTTTERWVNDTGNSANAQQTTTYRKTTSVNPVTPPVTERTTTTYETNPVTQSTTTTYQTKTYEQNY